MTYDILEKRKANQIKVIRMAMARNGIKSNSDMSRRIGYSETAISHKFTQNKSLRLEDIWTMNAVLKFTDAECRALVKGESL